jgi:hypothetical protein
MRIHPLFVWCPSPYKAATAALTASQLCAACLAVPCSTRLQQRTAKTAAQSRYWLSCTAVVACRALLPAASNTRPPPAVTRILAVCLGVSLGSVGCSISFDMLNIATSGLACCTTSSQAAVTSAVTPWPLQLLQHMHIPQHHGNQVCIEPLLPIHSCCSITKKPHDCVEHVWGPLAGLTLHDVSRPAAQSQQRLACTHTHTHTTLCLLR